MNLLQNEKLLILLDQAVFSGTSFLLTLLIASYLRVEDFGLYSGYILGIYLGVSILSAWVVQPFQVLVSKMNHAPNYLSFVFFGELLLLLVGSILFFVGKNLLPIAISPWVLCFALGFCFQDFGRKLLLALDKPLHTLLFDGLSSAAQLGAMLILFFASHKDLEQLLVYLSCAYVFPFVFLIFILKPVVGELKVWREYFLTHLQEGKWLFLTALTQWWSSNLFLVASGLYLGAAALGALRLSQSLFGVLNILLQTFENYVLPQTASKLSENENLGMSYLVDMSRKAGLVFLPILVPLFFTADHILVLVGGKDYAPYGFVLRGLCFLYVLIYLSQPIRIAIRALLLNHHFFIGYLITLGFALLSSDYFLSHYELNGAIIGLASSQLLLIIYWTYVLHAKGIKIWKSFISY